ncbi:MAG TPA: FAD-dependent oxidoreductase, partial [Longimicrobiales bacterium]
MPELFLGEGARPATPPIAVSDRSTEVNKTGSWKYIRPVYHDRVAPCNHSCPAGVDVQGYLQLLRDGRIDEALDLLAREHAMPAVTGRVCNHPCEDGCNRKQLDGAVAVHAVERMLGDRLLASPPPRAQLRPNAEKIAIVGSGPAGLSCAYHLARLGYQVDVLERAPVAGGMLRQGIPEYRLPRDVLDAQIARIEALGVSIRTGIEVTDATLPDLRNRYSVIFFATGAYRGRKLAVAGEELPGVWQGLEFLRRVNAGERPHIGERVVVIGGGNTAMDCARTALRLGARPQVLYRRTRDQMPAIPEEVEDAWREGVEFVFLAAPTAFREENGRLSGVACASMQLGDVGPDGRRRPVATGESLFVPADTVLVAAGEDADLAPLPAELVRDGAILIDEWGATGEAALFAGGDVAGDER